MNHYEVLGVKKNASQKEIREAYKKLVKKYHPDLYQGDKTFAEKKTQSINVAYDILSNPETKSAYDEELNPKPSYTSNYSSYSNYSNPNTSYTKPNYNTNNTKSSNYSYDNYKRTYSNTTEDFYQRRYTDYHRSKTPNSNYGTTYNQDTIIDKLFSSNAQKILAISIIFVIYFMTLFLNIANFNNYYTKNETKNNTSTNTTSVPSTSSPNSNSKFDSYLDFDINDYYNDKELYEAYSEYYTDYFDSFSDFKEAFSEYYYYTYID